MLLNGKVVDGHVRAVETRLPRSRQDVVVVESMQVLDDAIELSLSGVAGQVHALPRWFEGEASPRQLWQDYSGEAGPWSQVVEHVQVESHGQKLSDEDRYILDRQQAEHRPGMMLPRPRVG